MKLLLLFAAAGLLPAAAPIAEDRGAAGLWQSVKRLQTTVRVLHLTAHPDDEDGGTLVKLSRGLGADVVLFSLNRGESGANLVSGDAFEALGALRTAELLRAAEYYGARIRFTPFIDYGYSKNVAETFRNWDREQVLRDTVRIIREERPHVLLSRWQGTPRDGHGNHEAAGVMAQLAFEAAGDPKRFPEQIAAGLAAWQPLKLYADNRRESDDWTVRVDAGELDPVLGRSYAEIAREGLRFQKSQGAGGVLARPGPQISYYKLLASKAGMAEKEQSFFERLDTSLAAYPAVEKEARAALAGFRPEAPERIVPALAAGLDAVRRLRRTNPDRDLEVKELQFAEALRQAAGVAVEALVEPEELPAGPFAQFRSWETFSLAVPGQKFRVSVAAQVRDGADVKMGTAELLAPAGWQVERLSANRFSVTAPAGASYSNIYWARDSVRDNVYRLERPELFGTPLPPVPLTGRAAFWAAGVESSASSAVETTYLDAAGLQHRRPFAVGPAISVAFVSDAGVLPVGAADYRTSLRLRNNSSQAASGTLRLELPAGWSSEPASAAFSLAKEGEEASLPFRILPPADARSGDARIEAVATSGGRSYRASFRAILQGDNAPVYLSSQAVHVVRRVDVKTAPALRAGYIMGTGDEVPEGLRQLGISVELLDAAAVASADLSRYHTILLGIRAYAARPDVKTHNARLLDYVKNGGVLVVQYNTQEYDKNYGPYPYTMTRSAEEVSEEDSPVEILQPSDPVFQWPNRITKADFDGWVEQRGSKFFTTWDAPYVPLVETHDTGQAPQKGGWLTARYGKGLYVYCAYAWYRQLPFAVPGAFRLVANLVSQGAPDAPWRK